MGRFSASRSNGEGDGGSNSKWPVYGKRKTDTKTKSGYKDNPGSKRTAFSPTTSTAAARASTSTTPQPLSSQGQEDEPIAVDESEEVYEEETEEVRENATGEEIDESDDEEEEESVTVKLSDLHFDCPICFKPLTSPVFQCKNGHLACEICRNKRKNKCGECSLHIGHIRCRVIETVIESLRIPCRFSRYGCPEKLLYREKLEHEKTCDYVRCWCPLFDCDYCGTCSDFIQHIDEKHLYSRSLFVFDGSIRLTLNSKQKKQIILREENENVIFVINHSTNPLGSLVQVVCTGRIPENTRYSYVIAAFIGNNSIRLESVADNIQKLTESTQLTNCLLVPKKFIGCWANIRVELTIRPVD